MKKRLPGKWIFSLLMICLCFQTFSQNINREALAKQNHDTANYPYWIGMMQDQSVNFFDVQKAFEKYWKGREITRGSGWKPFKRWEYMMSQRVSPTGVRPAPDQDLKAWQDYFIKRGKSLRNLADWKEIGPRKTPLGSGGLGRLNAIAFHPADANIVWVGSPAGGLWKTTDGGLTWTSNTDNLPTLGVSSIVIDPSNPQIIYIGTGDRDAGDAAGLGVMKSTDGGLAWSSSNTGMGNLTVGKMIMYPGNNQLLLAATNQGAYKSTDGGSSWVQTGNFGDSRDIVFKPGDPAVVYCAAEGKLYKSTNTGDTWSQIGANTFSNGSRGAIGVTPAAPSLVYFFLCNSDAYHGMYRSADEGATFTEQSTAPNIMSWDCTGGSGGQAWYDLALAVSRTDPNVLYAGGVNIFKSTDGGQNWNITAHWYGGCSVAYAHADLHVLEWSPVNGYLYAGNDGGCFRTADNGQTWDFISEGLGIAQVYKIGQSATVKNLVINGYQDNGTSCFADTVFRNVMGGDGMDCVIDYTNAEYKYGEYYYGVVDRICDFNNQGRIAGQGANNITESGAWVTPFILHATNPGTMFIGYKSVWKSANIKDPDPGSVYWTKISNNLGNSNCAFLEQSPANPDILYVVKENNGLYRSDNANSLNATWINISSHLPNSSTPTSLEAHPTRPNTVYMTSGNKVYKSLDKGITWTDISGSLPNVHFSSIVYCKGSLEGLYLGTDIGVFYKDQTMTDWIPFTNGLPANGRVTEIEIWYDQANPANNRLRACTYGRGLWESKLYEAHPAAAFTVNLTTIPTACSVNFSDLSSGYPTSWKWTFQGGTPSTSTLQNPQNISYMCAGTYDVKLIVSNSQGSDSTILTGFIHVSNTLLANGGFTASDTLFCSGTPLVTFSDTSSYCPTGWHWSFSPAYFIFQNGTCATSQNPVVKFTHDGYYDVSCIISNINGSVTVSKSSYIRIGGLTAPFYDSFESGSFNTRAWTIENPDNDFTWEILNVTGNPPGIKSARIALFGTNSYGHLDRLVSPAIDLSGMQHAALTFKHAYAQYQSDVSDSLIIYVSENCGQSWMRIFSDADNGSGNFATHPPLTTAFVPSSSNDWCGGPYGSPCHVIDLGYFVGKKNIKIAFEVFSYMSNNLYLDDINIASSTGINEAENEDQYINIYPNPSSGVFFYHLKSGVTASNIVVMNPQGQVVLDLSNDHKTPVPDGKIDLTKLAKGVYSLQFNTGKGKMTRKLVTR